MKTVDAIRTLWDLDRNGRAVFSVAEAFRLSGGQARDAPEGRALPERFGERAAKAPLVMDRACEGDGTLELRMTPVVPPKSNRRNKWDVDRETCKRRNGTERLFRRIKGCRRIFTRFEKLDAMHAAFLCFALIVEIIKR